MTIREVPCSEEILRELIALSGDWAAENSCRGYRKNTAADIEGNRIFVAQEDGIIGYLFGRRSVTKEHSSVCPAETDCFEIEELYVRPEFRSRGIGQALFRHVEEQLSGQVSFLMLSTATKNFRAILHFYIDELGLEFWSARLYKKL